MGNDFQLALLQLAALAVAQEEKRELAALRLQKKELKELAASEKRQKELDALKKLTLELQAAVAPRESVKVATPPIGNGVKLEV